MIPAISAAALAGLFGSPHCMGMCGSFALACGGRISHTAAWHAGKILTYTVLGILAGLIGHSVPGPTWVATAVSATLVIWFAAGLAGLVPEPALRIPGLARLATRAATRGDLGSRFVFGMANGLLPCGLVYATLGIAVASGDPLTGGLAMAAFGLATAPALAVLGLGVRRLAAQRPWSRRVLALVVLLAGLWVVFQRQGMSPERMMRQHGGHAVGDSVPSQTR
ncbi:MAG TPA: sulfite exporter TauE/SafE family protein [Longimicrobiales bacterium]|nr:sulfite exporter TauE/SafE family protein [Longimicrobiales bacterium]